MSQAAFALAIRIALLSVGAVLVWRAVEPSVSHLIRWFAVKH